MNITKEEGEIAYKLLKDQMRTQGLKCMPLNKASKESLCDKAKKLGVKPETLYALHRRMAEELFTEHYPAQLDLKQ